MTDIKEIIEKALQEAKGLEGFERHLEQRLSVFSKDSMLGQELREIAVGFNPAQNLGAYSVLFNTNNLDDLWGHVALIGVYEPGRYAEKFAMSKYGVFKFQPIAASKDKKDKYEEGTVFVKGSTITANFIPYLLFDVVGEHVIKECVPKTYTIQEVYREFDIPFYAKEFKKARQSKQLNHVNHSARISPFVVIPA